MTRKKFVFSEEDVHRIVFLLNSDLSVQYIAERIGCSRSAVLAINRRFSVRHYAGRRTTWQSGLQCITPFERQDP
jgi:hypothetical protein